jgi:hypothetical protein
MVFDAVQDADVDSPHSFLARKRIDYADSLIQETSLTVFDLEQDGDPGMSASPI